MGQGAGINVLHVDDEPGFADLVADFLEQRADGIAVETATSATDGIDRLADGDFDCVVSDYQMPGQDGIEFLETIRAEDADLPFILFTGKGSEAVASDAIAAGATDYLQKQRGAEQYDLLANRIRNAVEQFRERHRRETLERIRSLLSEVNQALVRADSRATAESRVCEIISAADPYLFAWIGQVDSDTGQVVPRASAGIEDGYLDDVSVTVDETATGLGPAGTAFRERRVAVSQNIQDDPDFEHWREDALERGYRAVAAVPLEYHETLYGFLGVYADRQEAFDEQERSLLEELGTNLAQEIRSLTLQTDLQNERAFIEQGLNTLTDIFYVIDTDGTLRRWNDRVSAVTGYSEGDLAGMDVTEFFPTDERATVRQAFKDMQTGDVTVEADLLTADGDRVPYQFTGSALTDADGTLTGLIGIGRDISDHRARERRLRRQRATIRDLHDVAMDIDTCETSERVYELMVEAAESILDFDIAVANEATDSALVPKAISSRLSDEQYYSELPLDAEDSTAVTVYRTGESTITNDIRSDDATPADPDFLSALTVPIGERGVFQAVSETTDTFDETDRELAKLLASHAEGALNRLHREQELRRQNDRLEDFVRVVSHDIRNPLNVASGRLDIARQEYDSTDLDEVAQAHERMDALISDLLTLAKTEQAVDDITAVDLKSTCEACWQIVATDEATLVTETQQTIRADSNRLKQLLENLIRNAVEHGGGGVSVTVGDIEDGSGFYVADDGAGISEGEREQVFEAGHSSAPEGTGFGLSIVQRIADSHGWELRITESSGGGARFEITGVESLDG